MSPDSPKRPSLNEIKAALEEVNQAIVMHSQTLSKWTRNLVCNIPFDEESLKSDSYKACDFAHWCYGKHVDTLENSPAFAATIKAHKHIHTCLRGISIKLNNNEKVTTEEVDCLLEHEGDFLTALATLRDELFSLSYSYDYLTATLNRQAFFHLLNREYARLRRNGESCSLVMADLDYFKKINDQYGHQAGDEVLHHVATLLNEQLRPYDLICRYGGEEFLICLPNTDLKAAKNTIERVRAHLDQSEIQLSDGKTIRITASFGVAALSKDETWDKTVEHADEALYQAKNEGRNQTVVWLENGE
ncbi:diguanylate cyclase [Pseudomonadota bacterium]